MEATLKLQQQSTHLPLMIVIIDASVACLLSQFLPLSIRDRGSSRSSQGRSRYGTKFTTFFKVVLSDQWDGRWVLFWICRSFIVHLIAIVFDYIFSKKKVNVSNDLRHLKKFLFWSDKCQTFSGCWVFFKENHQSPNRWNTFQVLEFQSNLTRYLCTVL